MDHRLIQPASRDQIVAIIRQRAERANNLPAHLGQALFPAPAFIDFPGREREHAREAGGEQRERDQASIVWPVSHWSSDYITALSLVDSFIVMLRQLSCAIKKKLKAAKAPYYIFIFRWFFIF